MDVRSTPAGSASAPVRPVVFNETVHGPVIGYATVDGERVALSSARTTRGREVVAAFRFADLNANVPTDAESFFDVGVGDRVHVQLVLRGRQGRRDVLERAAAGAPPARGHRPADEGHRPLRVAWLPATRTSTRTGPTPADGTIVNWNNKPARKWEAADDNWGYGSVHRNNLLERTVDPPATHTLASTGRRDEQGGHAGPARR